MPQKYGPTGKLIFVEGPENRYQIVDRPGFGDHAYTIHNGDIISVKRGKRWIELQAWSDGTTWQFKTLSGRTINYRPVQFPARVRLT